MVVEVVGTMPVTHASSACGSTIATSDWFNSVDPARLATPIIGMPKRRLWAMMSESSGVSPEFDSTSKTSPLVIIPRSPWLASAG
jgi:hypothetical protein